MLMIPVFVFKQTSAFLYFLKELYAKCNVHAKVNIAGYNGSLNWNLLKNSTIQRKYQGGCLVAGNIMDLIHHLTLSTEG